MTFKPPNVPTEGQSYLTAVTQDRSVSGIRSTVTTSDLEHTRMYSTDFGEV